MNYRIARNFGGLAPNDILSSISGLKFGGMVLHTMHAEKKVGSWKAYHQTAKFNSPPNNFSACTVISHIPLILVPIVLVPDKGSSSVRLLHHELSVVVVDFSS